MPEQLKPVCRLVGTDGNVFALTGKVRSALRLAGQPEKAEEFLEQLHKCATYGDALVLMGEYVRIR